jgi:hypothetical protein
MRRRPRPKWCWRRPHPARPSPPRGVLVVGRAVRFQTGLWSITWRRKPKSADGWAAMPGGNPHLFVRSCFSAVGDQLEISAASRSEHEAPVDYSRQHHLFPRTRRQLPPITPRSPPGPGAVGGSQRPRDRPAAAQSRRRSRSIRPPWSREESRPSRRSGPMAPCSPRPG